MDSWLSVLNNKKCVSLILARYIKSSEDIHFEPYEVPLILNQLEANILTMSES